MKKLLFAAVLAVSCAFVAKAQKVNGIALKDLDAKVIELRLGEKLDRDVYSMLLDYGQDPKNIQNRYLMNEDGTLGRFWSIINATNVVSKNGYELMQVVQKIDFGIEPKYNRAFTSYILKKSKDK